MNKMIFVIVVLFLSISVVHAATRPNVVVEGFRIKEGLAEVGKDFTLELTLSDAEPTSCAKTVSTNVQAAFPFIMRGVATVSAGDICGKETKTVEIPMRVDPSAIGGFYQVTVVDSYESVILEQYSSTNLINVYVSGSPRLDARITDSSPVDVYAGDTAVLTVTLQNDGSYHAESIVAKMDEAPPLDVKWSQSTNTIASLAARQSQTLEFSVEVPKDMKEQEVDLSLHVTYLDENLEQKEAQFTLPFKIQKKAMFETKDAGSGSLYANQNRRLIKVLLENTGTDDARKVVAKVLPQFPISTDASSRYIPLLRVGESAPMEFSVDVDKDATSGDYVFDLLVNWEDASGKKFQDTTQVALTVRHKSALRAVFFDYWYLWAIVIIVIALVNLRRMRKRKK